MEESPGGSEGSLEKGVWEKVAAFLRFFFLVGSFCLIFFLFARGVFVLYSPAF